MISIEFLNVLYNNLKSSLIIDKKIVKGSVLLTFLNLKSNVRYNYLLKSSQSIEDESKMFLDELLEDGLIRTLGDENHYSITAKGVWRIEKDYLITENQLILFLDDKFFAIETQTKDLTDKERVILFSLIASRAFSKEFCIDLKQNEYLLNSMKIIIDKSYAILSKLGLIDLDIDDLYGKKGNEHIVSHLIRHTDSLPKKTKSIFVALGDQKYILDVSESGKINESKLVWIMKKIIDRYDVLELDSYDTIEMFLNSIPYEEGFNLYYNIDQSYVSSSVDDSISSVIKKLILEI